MPSPGRTCILHLAAALAIAGSACWPAVLADQSATTLDPQQEAQSDLSKLGNKNDRGHRRLADNNQPPDKGATDIVTSAPCISWISPLVKPRVALLCIHGLGLYSGAYRDFGLRMSRHGVAVYAIDVRGFGSWMKAKGHQAIDFNACVEDIKTTLESIRKAHPGLPVFLLGESMGGAIALRATAQYPDLIDGLISSVPAGDRFHQKRQDLLVALHMLKGPHKDFDIGKSIVDQATVKPLLRERWQDNPLDRMDLSPDDLIQFQRFMNDNFDNAEKITDKPVLIVQGCKDHLVKPEGTIDLFNAMPTPQKDLFMFGNSEHLIFEDNQDTVHHVRLVLSWLDVHLPKGFAPLVANSDNNGTVTLAMTYLIKGQFDQSKQLLEDYLAAAPNDAEAHYWMGISYLKLNKLQLAKREFATAMNLGSGSTHAQEANNFLMQMPADVTAPSTKDGAAPNMVAGSKTGKPMVILFYAKWCQQCDQLDALMEKAKATFGDKVTFQKVDVGNESSAELIKQYDVGPIPTVIYLKSNGQVATHTLGNPGFVNFAKGVEQCLAL